MLKYKPSSSFGFTSFLDLTFSIIPPIVSSFTAEITAERDEELRICIVWVGSLLPFSSLTPRALHAFLGVLPLLFHLNLCFKLRILIWLICFLFSS